MLDIGCGAGDDVAYFSEKKRLKAEGIDISLAAISEAREKHPDIAVKFGDGEFLGRLFVRSHSTVCSCRMCCR